MRQIAKLHKDNMQPSPQRLWDALEKLFDEVSAQIGSAPLFSAVSGGADSLSLAHTVQQYADKNGLAHTALVVNHNIRTEAEAEAAAVMAELARHHINAECLTIKVPPPDGDIQNWARKQRFSKLASRARNAGGVLLLGHHADDQAETILMRLNKQSSLSGLKGMQAVSHHEGVACLRPFLARPKHELMAYCANFDIRYLTDRSNFDRKFERVRMRQFLEYHATAHLGGEAIQMAALSSQIDTMLQRQLQDWLASHMLACSPVEMRLARQPFEKLPAYAQIYVLRYVMQFVGASAYPASFDAVKATQSRILSGSASTLSGCYSYATAKAVSMQAEWGRKPPRGAIDIQPDRAVIYDNRWIIKSALAGQIMRYGELKQAYPEAAQAVLPQLARYRSRPRDMIPCLLGLDGQIKAPHFKLDRNVLYLEKQTQEAAITVWPKHIPELLDGFFRYGHLKHEADVQCS